MPSYKIVRGSPELVEEKICKMMHQGWRPLGGPISLRPETMSHSSGVLTFHDRIAQAMVQDSPDLGDDGREESK